MEITKVIIPAAGLGTRFLPYTKAIPKEMLPIGNQPAIQCIVEEALAATLHNFLVVTGRGKEAIANYFDTDALLEQLLHERNQDALLTKINRITRMAHFTYVRQSEPMGLGHAVYMARHAIGKEYCAVMLPDDLIFGESGIGQLIRVARQERASVIAVQEVPAHMVSNYGIITIKKQITPNLFQVSGLVEKPSPKDAPSNLAIVGRYVLSHKIFPALEEVMSHNATPELQLTDGIAAMVHNNERLFAYKIQGTRYDIGTPAGWLQANIDYGLQQPNIAQQLEFPHKDLSAKTW